MRLRIRFPPYPQSVLTLFFISFTEIRTCWIWKAKMCGKNGRPNLISTKYGREAPSRISYRIHKGKLPEGVHVKQLCGMITCVNPDHLVITSGEQVRFKEI